MSDVALVEFSILVPMETNMYTTLYDVMGPLVTSGTTHSINKIRGAFGNTVILRG